MNEVGEYWSVTPQNGGLQSQMDLALLLQWVNTAENIYTKHCSKGTTIFSGTAAPQNITEV